MYYYINEILDLDYNDINKNFRYAFNDDVILYTIFRKKKKCLTN